MIYTSNEWTIQILIYIYIYIYIYDGLDISNCRNFHPNICNGK